MGCYATIEYLKYIWKAKGRHGVHSPFVYNLVDKGLKGNAPLREKLSAYFGDDKLVFMGSDSSKWQSFFKDQEQGKILVAQCVHHTEENSLHWNEIIAKEEVKMSIDLFSYGLLFFNPEFKEKQHFTLKQST